MSGKISRKQADFTDKFNTLVLDVFTFRYRGARGRFGNVQLNHASINGARLHTIPYRFIADETHRIVDDPTDELPAFEAWTEAFTVSGRLLEGKVQNVITALERGRNVHGYTADNIQSLESLLRRIKENVEQFAAKRAELIAQLRLRLPVPHELEREFVTRANNCIGNVYNLGAHRGVNNPLSDRVHGNFSYAAFTPQSRALISAIGAQSAVARLELAMTSFGANIIGQLTLAPMGWMTPETRSIVERYEAAELKSYSLPAMTRFAELIRPQGTSRSLQDEINNRASLSMSNSQPVRTSTILESMAVMSGQLRTSRKRKHNSLEQSDALARKQPMFSSESVSMRTLLGGMREVGRQAEAVQNKMKLGKRRDVFEQRDLKMSGRRSLLDDERIVQSNADVQTEPISQIENDPFARASAPPEKYFANSDDISLSTPEVVGPELTAEPVSVGASHPFARTGAAPPEISLESSMELEQRWISELPDAPVGEIRPSAPALAESESESVAADSTASDAMRVAAEFIFA